MNLIKKKITGTFILQVSAILFSTVFKKKKFSLKNPFSVVSFSVISSFLLIFLKARLGYVIQCF